ncbi:sugar phosphate isomerase/epimerase [Lentisphaera profundi]|uniref:Sugar phosphate isomerase/epimerase n=1 Tax=Lentisphaera profundi TaxID=1658616 RepID=A0ABY7VSP2_9BACT|nr:sugar phosphate isomerase/epimerase family protein [Lentisphaera profundi]WDE95861.1 sugar phosphate isomerase/epimerase [Lentisphaera profundi]
MIFNRRNFVKGAGALTVGSIFNASCASSDPDDLFKISLAQWSLHKKLFAKELDNLDFPEFTKKTCGIGAVEYVNKFFKNSDAPYLSELKKRCDDNGVKSLLIMCDGLGYLGDANETKRKSAVENHYTWVEAAKFLGCHSIRVNARSKGSYDEQMGRASDGLASLSTFAAKHQINVIVENHGGLSSNGKWLAGVMKKVDMPNCGTLPDFGNFKEYDRYQGVQELMPYAKGVSAKSHDFDEYGNEIHTDYEKMIKIVLDAGYRGYVGVEYEGKKLKEVEGIKATRDLLIKIRKKI